MVMISFGKKGKGFKPKSKSKVAVAKAPIVTVGKAAATAIRAIAKSTMKKELETKYVADELANNILVTAGASVPAGLIRMLPRVAQGLDDFNRIGDKIEPTSAITKWTVHFQNGVSTNFEDLQLNLLVLAVKGAKNSASVAQTPANSLLRNGQGGNTDPTVGAFTQNQFIEQVNHYPVNTDQFTVLRHFKHRFAKGSYDITGVPGVAASTQIAREPPCVTFTYKWKPPPLIYNSTLDVLPTNHYPVYILWVSVNDAGAYSGNLVHGCRTDLYFKDA